MTITVQKNKVTFNKLKNGKWSLTLKDTFNKVYKMVCDTWFDLTTNVYELADNNDIGAELNHKMCNKMQLDVFGNVLEDEGDIDW